VAALRTQDDLRILVGVPVGAPETCEMLEQQVDELVCVERPRLFFGVGAWYSDFAQTTDGEVRRLLDEARSGWGR
jgi:putative phosphoribosyl transferase